MKTLVTDSAEQAAVFVRSGELAAFPTETVYGLGADALNEEAVRKIFSAKERPTDNPLIVHVGHSDQIDDLTRGRSEYADLLVKHFFPGPLTVIFEKSKRIPESVTAGLDSVGIRMPQHPVAARFLSACARPVAAPSANISGRPSPTSWEAVHADLDGRIACILRGGRSHVGLESTVVDCTSSFPVVLRAGAITLEQLRSVIPGIELGADGRQEAPRSPGLRHRHYAPNARIVIVEHPPTQPGTAAGYIGLDKPSHSYDLTSVCASAAEYAHELFDFFRRCDTAGLETIYCQRVQETGIGLALMDRLRRAGDAGGDG